MVISFGEVLMDCFPDKNVIGGAPFNVAVHLKRLGEESSIITKIGADSLGLELKKILEREGLTDHLQIDASKPTGKVVVTLENGQPSYDICKDCGWEHIEFKKCSAPQYFVFGSLALSFENNRDIFKKYRDEFTESNFLCDLNLREPFYDRETIEVCLKSADILKINDEELEYLAKEFNQLDVIYWLKNKFNISKILLTKGSKGACVYWDNQHLSCAIKKVNNLTDTVGAGDSFTSLFLYGLLKGQDISTAMRNAADFAGLICQTSGAVPQELSVYEQYKI
jgi:fructokinase